MDINKEEVLKANEPRQMQAIIENASEKDYKGIVSCSLITHCPMTKCNTGNACAIFVPDLASIRGKKNSAKDPSACGGRLCGSALHAGGK